MPEPGTFGWLCKGNFNRQELIKRLVRTSVGRFGQLKADSSKRRTAREHPGKL